MDNWPSKGQIDALSTSVIDLSVFVSAVDISAEDIYIRCCILFMGQYHIARPVATTTTKKMHKRKYKSSHPQLHFGDHCSTIKAALKSAFLGAGRGLLYQGCQPVLQRCRAGKKVHKYTYNFIEVYNIRSILKIIHCYAFR